MTPCVMCMTGEGDALSGGYCAACRPMDVNISREQVGPEALAAASIVKAFGRRERTHRPRRITRRWLGVHRWRGIL